MGILQDISRQEQNNIQQQIIESTDNNYFLCKTKRKLKNSILHYEEQETPRGSLDVQILDLDLFLEIVWSQKCVLFSSVTEKTCALVLSANITLKK